jgi:simple sugar transport system ATP-binding protein
LRTSVNPTPESSADHVDIGIRKGEVHCLIGENGREIDLNQDHRGGCHPQPRARIKINGKHYPKLKPDRHLRQGNRSSNQDLSLFPNMTLAENIPINQLLESNTQA